jgi:hypothetical protein
MEMILNAFTFKEFAQGPGGKIARRLGVPCDKSTTWAEYTDLVQRYARDSGRFARLRAEAGALSPGETAVACALLHATDLSYVADEVDGGRAWRRLDNVHGVHRSAVVAAILRQDSDSAEEDGQ